MRRAFSHSVCMAVVTTAWLYSETAKADSLPTHGSVVHMNNFISGWPVEPTFPIPGPNTVVPGNGTAPDPEYNVLGPFSTDTQNGNDGLTAPNHGWHWQFEIDLDPYFNSAPIPQRFKVGDRVRVIFDFTAGGGPRTGVRLVPLVQGPEFLFDIHQPDQADWFNLGGPKETGGIRKLFVNATQFPVAWGTAVTEDPDGPGSPDFDQLGKVITFPTDSSLNFSALENTDLNNQFNLSTEADTLVFTQISVPEPTSLALLPLLALPLRRRR